MNTKLAIVVICLAASCFLLAEISSGAEIDGNSTLHFGFSTVIGLGTSVMTANVEDDVSRRWTAWGMCMVPGVVKELSDQYISAGDLAFDALGCVAGIALFEGINVVATHDRVALVGRW